MSNRLKSATREIAVLLVLAALAVLGIVMVGNDEEWDREQELRADYRAPVANPPVDPNRPDLFEEPEIEK